MVLNGSLFGAGWAGGLSKVRGTGFSAGIGTSRYTQPQPQPWDHHVHNHRQRRSQLLQQQSPESRFPDINFLKLPTHKMMGWANSESYPSGPKRSTQILHLLLRHMTYAPAVIDMN